MATGRVRLAVLLADLLVRSVELTLDPAGDALVRGLWGALAEAGIPSLADHQGASNRPHVTLAAGAGLEVGSVLERLGGLLPPVGLVPGGLVPGGPGPGGLVPGGLPLGGLLLFPASRGRVVLAWAVVLTPALAALHRAVHDLVPGAVQHTLPGRWSPHITLAMRLTPEELAAAVPIVHRATSEIAASSPGADHPDSREPDVVGIGGMRFWNGDDRTITPL